MRYTAASLAAATRPVVLTIGRVSDRRVLQLLSRWWIRTARTWSARPLSVPQMLALQAHRANYDAYRDTLSEVLRAVFPRRWWYRLVGDPVTLLMDLPRDLRERVLGALVTVPGSDRVVSHESADPHEALRAAQRASINGGVATGGAPSLAAAALSVRATFGDSWYWNPQRWTTSDGYVPFAVALIEYAGVQALDVRRRLEVADGYSLAHAKPHVRQQVHRLAYPMEVC